MSGIRIVTKSDCPFCTMAKNWLKEHAFEYTEDLIDNEEETKLESTHKEITNKTLIFKVKISFI